MGQGSSGESKGTTSSIDVLVAETEHDLCEIGFRTLGFGRDHLIDAVEIG